MLGLSFSYPSSSALVCSSLQIATSALLAQVGGYGGFHQQGWADLPIEEEAEEGGGEIRSSIRTRTWECDP